MNRTTLLTALLALAAVTATATPRTRQQALQIAQQQAARHGAAVTAADQHKAKNAPAGREPYYVFNNAASAGYTIVSADDELPAIVGYATTGSLDEATMPAALKAYLATYAAFTQALQNGDATARAMAREAAALKTSATYQPATVAPLLGAICWTQDGPFSQMCPLLPGDDEHCVVGCVATAMAQVIAYNRWPEHQMAAFPAYTSKGVNFLDSITIDMPEIENTGAVYDYDNMLPAYREGLYTQQQADAVALLSYHCGRAVMMGYGDTSSANVFRNNLATYFGYDLNDLSHLYRMFYTQEQWQQIIDRELTNKRAILIGGSSNGGGHEFVLDGADGNGLYHINWGWAGSGNGYFDLAILNPEKGGIGSGNGTDGYLRYMDIIIGIGKPGTVTTDPIIEPVCAVTAVEGQNAITWTKDHRTGTDATFEGQARIAFFANQYHHAFTGYLGLRVTDANGKQQFFTDDEQNTLKPDDENATFLTFPLDGAWPSGRYVFEPVYSTDGQTWYLCETQIGTQTFAMTDTDILSADATPSLFTATLTADDDIYDQTTNAFTLNVTNTSAVEEQGMFTLYVSTDAETDDVGKKYDDVYLIMPAGTTVEQSLAYYPRTEGDFYLTIVSPDSHILINRQKFTAQKNGEDDDVMLQSLTSSATADLETTDAYYEGIRVKAPIAYDGTVTFTARVTNTGTLPYKGPLTFSFHDTRGTTAASQGSQKVTMILKAGETKDVSSTYTPDELTDIHSVLCTVKGVTTPTTTWTLPAVSPDDADITLAANQLMVYISQQTTGITTPTTTTTDAPKAIYTLSGQRLERITQPGLYIIDGQKTVIK